MHSAQSGLVNLLSGFLLAACICIMDAMYRNQCICDVGENGFVDGDKRIY